MTTTPKAPLSTQSAKLTFHDGMVIDLPIVEGKEETFFYP